MKSVFKRWIEIKPEKTCPNCNKVLNSDTLVNCILAKNVNNILNKLITEQKQKKKEMCEDHGKILDYFCQDCQDLVCPD